MKTILKKYYPLLLAALVLLGLGLLLLGLPRLPRQPKEENPVTMFPPTIPVGEDTQQAIKSLLETKAPERGVFVYQITDISCKAAYCYASVAGYPLGTEAPNLDIAIWLGRVTLAQDGPGEVEDFTVPMNEGGGTYIVSQPGDYGGSGYQLPFANGTTAMYGVLGVHNCGFALNGWKAVDLFPSTDMVYASIGGEVTYVCRDGTQMALRIGDSLYTHLEDNGTEQGRYYNQGQAISSLVPGSYTASCGYAAQAAGAAHVHFCFPDYGTFQADGYTLDTTTGLWTKGSDTVDVEGTLTADWANATVDPGQPPNPTGGGNFWDMMTGAMLQVVYKVLPVIPDHKAMQLAERVLTVAATTLEVIYWIILTNFDMTVPIWVFSIWIVLELARLIYIVFVWIAKIIDWIKVLLAFFA